MVAVLKCPESLGLFAIKIWALAASGLTALKQIGKISIPKVQVFKSLKRVLKKRGELMLKQMIALIENVEQQLISRNTRTAN